MQSIKEIILALITFALLVSVGFNIHYRKVINEIPTESYIDTIPFYKPIPKDSIVIRYITKTLPVAPKNEEKTAVKDTAATLLAIADTYSNQASIDSVDVAIPVTQKYYKEDEYEAWISGYMPSLDSINIYAPTKVINHYEKTPLVDVSIGLQGGIGWIGGNNYRPYIGIGVQIGIPLRKIYSDKKR